MNKILTASYYFSRLALDIPASLEIDLRYGETDKKYGQGYLLHNYSPPWEFSIYINSRYSLKYNLDVISHEMRHIWQMYNRVLIVKRSYDGEYSYYWNNKLFDWDDYPLCAHPHEADANLFMKGMRNPLGNYLKNIS